MKKLALTLPIFVLMGMTPAHGVDPAMVAPMVSKYANSKALANPSVSIVDLNTGDVVYSRAATLQRKPASTLKLMSAIAAYTYLTPTATFPTEVYMGTKGKSVVIRGSYDPWISYREPEASKMGRTSLVKIGYNALQAVRDRYRGSASGLTVYYSGLWPRDVANLKVFFKKRGLRPTLKAVTDQDSLVMAGDYIRSSSSPDVATMVNWALTWSDNDVSTNLAKIASKAAGNGLSSVGIDKTFHTVLDNFGIDGSKFYVKDGSGVSGENYVTADLMSKVLIKIHSDPKLAVIINGLPVGGMTGTLRHRFIETAPDAVGLVKAKTGTLRDTVSLAGFVESGDREYAFVVIADNIRSGSRYHELARNTVDRLLGGLAQPLSYTKSTAVAESATAVVNS